VDRWIPTMVDCHSKFWVSCILSGAVMKRLPTWGFSAHESPVRTINLTQSHKDMRPVTTTSDLCSQGVPAALKKPSATRQSRDSLECIPQCAGTSHERSRRDSIRQSSTFYSGIDSTGRLVAQGKFARSLRTACHVKMPCKRTLQPCTRP
jgi:hypothetical protein